MYSLLFLSFELSYVIVNSAIISSSSPLDPICTASSRRCSSIFPLSYLSTASVSRSQIDSSYKGADLFIDSAISQQPQLKDLKLTLLIKSLDSVKL